MSQATTPDSRTVLEADVDTDLLLRNARRVDIAGEREEETESWMRGKTNASEAAVDSRPSLGVMVVQLPDGSPHGTLLIEADGPDRGPWVGACDCDGWIKGKKGACAHLVTRAVRSVLRDGEVPVDVERFQALAAKADAREDGDSSTTDDGEAISDVGGLEDAGEIGVSRNGPEGRDTTTTPDVVDVSMPHTAGDPFAQQLDENVPERFVMDLGAGPYIRRAGYAAIARNANLRVTVEPITAAEETDFTHARYHARVLDGDGEILGEDFGTAHLEGEDLEGAEYQLDELASTRAIRRALEWATGAGTTLRRGGE